MFVATLLQHPGEQAKLVKDPSILGEAVEELLRFVPSNGSGGNSAKVLTADIELAGVGLPAGAMVFPSLMMANRDPAVFDRPDELDLTRGGARHMAFGIGIHSCLGAPLSRVILQEAVGGLLRRLPDLRLAVPANALRRQALSDLIGLEELPVTWGAADA
jgi:cytochrome P450